MIKKQALRNRLEPFIYEKLEKDEYKQETINSKKLLTWNRLDLAFKLFYLDNKEVNYYLAERVYAADIKAQTLGSFIEFGNEENKNSFKNYIDDFHCILNDIELNGFNKEKTLIPLSKNYTIINGSHRTASAIFLNQNINCIKTEQNDMIADYKYFYERDVSFDILNLVVRKFIEYSTDNTYIAFLWPSGKNNKDDSESKFSNIVYKKEIKLTPNGAFNLLIELYKHMDWVGNAKNGFQGAKQKLIECFPSFEKFTVIVFQEESLEEVRLIKEKVRQIHGIGFSSIHITDTKEEAIRISNLIFNDNGLHFLNYANPYKYVNIYSKLDIFKDFLKHNKIETEAVVIDGSVILSLYGLRKNEDIDYLILDNERIKKISLEFEMHDSELRYHDQNKYNLIYDARYYFQYYGLKFISFNQLYKMKKKRNEEKDIHDCNMMNSLLQNNKLKKLQLEIKQKLFYLKIKNRKTIRLGLLSFLRNTGLYVIVRWFYRKLKGTK